MTKEDFLKGENGEIEFKGSLPEKTENFTKTFVAFANGKGGKLIVGIDDKTHDIIGVPEDKVFKEMDKIANAVTDSCEPQIIPDITFQTIDGKTIIVAEVEAGKNRPYYLKTKGKEAGVYVRVSGTSHPASPEKIHELELEGNRISWDEQICINYEVKDKDVKKLIADINKYREENSGSDDKPKKVTKAQLINWGVLQEASGELLASNAFVLLTGDHFRFARTQCAVFKGTERDEFIDKKEFSGSLYSQIEDAYAFILKHINYGAKIDGLVRKEQYELPVSAIREMLVNAECHRLFTDNSCVQVALYDDRLEVTSPGGLYSSLTIEQALSGHSKLRNKVLAEVFSQMGLIEAWGTGLGRIKNKAKEYGLPAPEFIEIGESFRVNLYRKNTESGVREKFGENSLNSNERIVSELLSGKSKETLVILLSYLLEHGEITTAIGQKITDKSAPQVRRYLNLIEEFGIIKGTSGTKSKKYILNRSFEQAIRSYI